MINYSVVMASLKKIQNAVVVEGMKNGSSYYVSLELEDPQDVYATAGQYIIMDTAKTHRIFEKWKNLFKAKKLEEGGKLTESEYTLNEEDIKGSGLETIKGVVFMSKTLPQPMCRKYTSNIKDAKGNLIHKAGDWIVGRNGKIKLYTTVSITCRLQTMNTMEGEESNWAQGEDPDTMMQQQINNFLYPMEEAGLEVKAKPNVDKGPAPEEKKDEDADDIEEEGE